MNGYLTKKLGKKMQSGWWGDGHSPHKKVAPKKNVSNTHQPKDFFLSLLPYLLSYGRYMYKEFS